MREQILELLENKIVYPESAVKNFLDILSVRAGKNSEIYNTITAALKNQLQEIPSTPLFSRELKYLNCVAIHQRLREWRKNKHPETVVTRYLEKFAEELENPTFFGPSADLQAEEYTMLHSLLENTRFNQDKTELEGINNKNLRLTLQLWVLYPELISLPDSCEELVEGLSISNCKF